MRVERHQLAERQGVSLVQSLTVTDLRWLFREQAVSDIGIDAHLEIVIDGRATGRLLAIQIKTGESYFRETVTEGFVYRGDPDHLDYWLHHSLPVVVVICKPGTGEAYWQIVSEQTVTRTDRGWKMTIPSANPFRVEAMTRLQEIALAGGTTSEERHQLARPEGLTHPDAMLGALLVDSDLVEKGRCVIETSSITYTCCRIASHEDLIAVLVSTNSPDGTALVLHRSEGRWSIAADVPVRTKYSDSLPARFVLAESGYCLVIQHPTMWGTGTLLEEQRWYLLAQGPRLILSFPVRGYVAGWGLLFDREIMGECTSAPTELRSGTRVDLKFTVRYSPSSDIRKYRDTAGFNTAYAAHLEWQQASQAFSLLSNSDISPEDAFGLYGDNDAGFVRRQLHLLERLAFQPAQGVVDWLADLAERASPEEREVLRQAIARANA